MEFAEVAARTEAVPHPHIPSERGRILYDHVREARPERVLELGTARGVSAAYIAAALEANGAGTLTTVDSTTFPWVDPTPEEVLGGLGLLHRVELDRTHSTYTWFLKERIEERSDQAGNCEPLYDLCFVDGGKSWTTDGLAVFLIEKLLRSGGWLLLDDLDWRFDDVAAKRAHYFTPIPLLSESERREPHIAAVFRLLVMQHPSFTDFRIQDEAWGWARKAPGEPRRLTIEAKRTFRSYLHTGLRRLARG